MLALEKIFVVIDPTTDQQSALENAAWIASQGKEISLHVYDAVFSARENADVDALQRVELARHRAWLESLLTPIRAAGTEVTVEIEWTAEWRDALAPAAERSGADLIVKSASAHSGASRRMLKTSDWTLLRDSHCPVYLIKKDAVEPDAKVLVALDIKREDELHSELNSRVVDFGRAFADTVLTGGLHAVNAYASSISYVYPSDLAAAAGIESTDAYTIEGAPEKAIPEIAEQIGAGVVIIGTAARGGIKAAVIGNTVEKILDALDTNILTVIATKEIGELVTSPE